METHSSILAWRIPWTEEPGGLQSIWFYRVRHNWSDLAGTWPWNPTPGYVSGEKHGPKGCMNPSDQCSTVYEAKSWKQPNVHWQRWYIYTMEYYSAFKKNEIMPFAATCMDLEIVTLSEVSQRNRNIVLHPFYIESEKPWYKWTYLQKRNRLTDLENEFMVAGRRMGGRNS